MRQWIAILLLGAFTLTGTELHELLKVPLLVSHFQEHQAEKPMSWWQFMEEHYAREQHHHAGGDRHHDLPFHCDHHCGAQQLQARLDGHPTSLIIADTALEVELIATEDHIPSQEGPSDIWQPPRA